jgi:small subunit ribosomal protein S15
MSLTKEEKAKIIGEYGKNKADTGSTEAQVALLTVRINELTEHFKIHKKDHNSRRGLMKLVGKRRRLLNYLMREDLDRYRTVLKGLDLRK